MISYFFKRVLGSIPTLFLLCVFLFFLLRLAPGGPFDGERAFPPEVMAQIQKNYGLDQPLLKQFWVWFQHLLMGDLGESFQYLGRSVSEILGDAMGPSFQLGIVSIFISLLIGIPLGVLSAWKQGTWMDSSAMFFAVAGISLPSYLIASLLVLIFSIQLGWLPAALWEGPESFVLPVITLSLRPIAIIARLVRSSVLDVLASDFIRTAHAKGLPTWKILFKHALKNSLIPVITVLGPIAASLVTGSFLVEMIFQIPGLGKHFVTAVLNRDYPLVMGIALFYGVFLVFANLFSDLLCALADPRIRLEKGAESS